MQEFVPTVEKFVHMIFTEAYSGPNADSKVAQYTSFISFRIIENLLHVAGNIVTPRHYSYDKKDIQRQILCKN